MSRENILLKIDDLKLYYHTTAGYVRAVDGVSLDVAVGERLGLVGESGCGKTTLMKAILRLLPANCRQMGGEMYYKGKAISLLSEKEIQKLRWQEISMIPQSAMNALDPVYRIGAQIKEAMKAHQKGIGSKEAQERAADIFELVGINPKRLRDYPHQFSGGMKQRAAIAMALVLNPNLIIADEPTTALDVIVQAQILERINALQQSYSGSLIMITHDISVIAQTCEKVAVMYAGKIMEYGTVRNVLNNPLHPYTLGLKNAFPSLLGEKKALISIPGSPPDLIKPQPGCLFAPRCPFAIAVCKTVDPPAKEKDGRVVACHRLAEMEGLKVLAEDETIWERKVHACD